MDGGIIDNQGTSSLITGNSFSESVDLFLISDVSSPYMEKLKPTKRNSITSLISFIFSMPMLLISLVLLIWSYRLESRLIYSFFFLVFAVLLASQGLMLLVSKKVKTMTGRKFRLPSLNLGIFLLDRINSLIHMTSEISLKGYRRANASAIYKEYGNKTISSMIYELRCLNTENKPENSSNWTSIKKHLGEIPDSIKNLSISATNFGTTLWFNDKRDISIPTVDTLIACGEVTACFNLLSFLIVHKKTQIEDENSIEYELFTILKEIWVKFKIDPYHLVNSRIN